MHPDSTIFFKKYQNVLELRVRVQLVVVHVAVLCVFRIRSMLHIQLQVASHHVIDQRAQVTQGYCDRSTHR
jgi:hypothetical protein